MSRKISVFAAAVPTPLTKRDFTMICTSLPLSSILVQSATFPTEEVGTVAVPVRGQQVQLPSVMNAGSGVWTFEVADSALTAVRYELLTLLYSHQLFDVTLIPGNIVDSVTSLGNILSNARGLLNIASTGAAMLLSSAILRKCFVKKISDGQFSNEQAAIDAQKWVVSVQYNYIDSLAKVWGGIL